MEQLKECVILEAFRGLDPDRQKDLLNTLIAATNRISATIEFSHPGQQKFFEFAREEWPEMTLTFFNETWRRWELLRELSYGGSCYCGDLYLQATHWGDEYDDYDECPFKDEEARILYFHGIFLKECSWEYMWISKLTPGEEYITKYDIKKLMKLSETKFEIVMKKYGFYGNL